MLQKIFYSFTDGKQKKSTENNAVNKLKLTTIEDDTGSKMYVELLSKQLTKPCLQTQEMKLVREDGQSKYVILADDGSLISQDVTIVTRQNNDGTISLTALKGRLNYFFAHLLENVFDYV